MKQGRFTRTGLSPETNKIAFMYLQIIMIEYGSFSIIRKTNIPDCYLMPELDRNLFRYDLCNLPGLKIG